MESNQISTERMREVYEKIRRELTAHLEKLRIEASDSAERYSRLAAKEFRKYQEAQRDSGNTSAHDGDTEAEGPARKRAKETPEEGRPIAVSVFLENGFDPNKQSPRWGDENIAIFHDVKKALQGVNKRKPYDKGACLTKDEIKGICTRQKWSTFFQKKSLYAA